MNRKLIALALGSLLVLLPGVVSAQMNTGGTQTFTVPRLTVTPGPLTVAGTFSITGDLELGSGAQLILPDGTAADPALTWTSDPDNGFFYDTAHQIALSGAGVKYGYFGSDSATVSEFVLYAPHVGATEIAVELESTTSHSIKLGNFDSGGTAVNLFNNASSTTLIFGTSQETSNFWINAAPGGTFEIDFNPGFGADHNTLVWADPTGNGDLEVTIPSLAGTLLVGGATNTLGAVTTTINSGTQFNIHSNANITLDGDADNDGTGTVSILSSNDTQQVLLTNTAVTVNSDADITLNADDTTNNASLTLDGDGNAATLSVSDGTDTADYRAGQNSITLDADVDDDGDGTVLLSAGNSASTVTVTSTAVGVTSSGAVRLQSNGQPTELNSIDHSTIPGSQFIDLTEATATNVATFATATGAHGGGTFGYSVFAEDATDHQVRTASAFFSYSNKGGTLICSATVDSAEDVVVSGGTLTCTPDCNVSGTTAQLRLDCTSSLTQTSLQAFPWVAFHGAGGTLPDVTIPAP